ncbi:SsrA-binding protein SmpB [Candidatus Kuenenbacteria bacterium]|nr:SsrA-binding protein SmpB [Candidatus Kuenenbacteria bacterium]
MSIADNKKAYFDYEILETLEAGLALSGPEAKSIKKGQINLKGSYVGLDGTSSAFLIKAHVAPYKPAAIYQKDYDPYQNRSLLLHKKQLKYLFGKSREPGITIVPLKVYLKGGLIKLEIGVGRGKKKFDKRESIKKKEFERRKQRLIDN